MNLKLYSLNVKGLNSPYKRRALWTDALKHECDIICIQESHFALDKTPKFNHHKFPHIFLSSCKKKKKGVITAIKDTISFKLINLINDAQGRYIILVASIDNVIYTIVNIYAPNKNPHQFIQKILKKTRKSYILWRLQCTYGPRYGHLQGRNYLQEGIISHFFLRRHVWCLEMPAHNGKGLHFFFTCSQILF